MAPYKVINWQQNKYVLNQVEVNTTKEKSELLFGYPHVLLFNGGQFMPLNVHFDITVGVFKVVWIIDNWVGNPSFNYGRINEGFSPFIARVCNAGVARFAIVSFLPHHLLSIRVDLPPCNNFFIQAVKHPS